MKGIFKILDIMGSREISNNPNVRPLVPLDTEFLFNDIVPYNGEYTVYQFRCMYAYSNLDITNQVRCMDYVKSKYANNPVSVDIVSILKSILTKTPYESKYDNSIHFIKDLSNILNILDTYEHGISENAFSIFSLYCHLKLLYKNSSENIISNTIKLLLSEYRFIKSTDENICNMMNGIGVRYHVLLRELVELDTFHSCIHIPLMYYDNIPKVFVIQPSIPIEHYNQIVNTFYPNIKNLQWEETWNDSCTRDEKYGSYFNGIFTIS